MTSASGLKRSSWRGGMWLFVATLCLHGAYLLFVVTPDLVHDEARYLGYAQNLMKGYFADPNDPQLVNGPGYPVLVWLMMTVGMPVTAMRAASVLLIAFAVWFTYRAILPYAGPAWAFGFGALLGMHPMLLYVGPYVMSEGLALFCVAGFCWAVTSLMRRERSNIPLTLLCIAILGWLTLTRVLFGYVLAAVLVLSVIGFLVHRARPNTWLRTIMILAASLAVCSPYLVYSYRITGEVFKWSTNGGELLYWATSTNPGERGNWFNNPVVLSRPELKINHGEFIERIETLPYLEREARFRQRALQNLEANPMGVLQNWVANVNRLFFGFPRSFRYEEAKTTVLMIFQLPVIALGLLALYCMAKRPRLSRPETYLLVSLSGIYLGLSSLLPAEVRYFIVVLPWLGFIIAATLGPRLSVRLRVDGAVTEPAAATQREG